MKPSPLSPFFRKLLTCMSACAAMGVANVQAATVQGDYGVSTTGYIYADGLVSATAFKGNGSGLTNISSGDRIASGSSTVIAQSDGNVIISTTSLYLNPNSSRDSTIEVGGAPTGNRFAYIDLTGDTTYLDYGLRIIRDNTGANASSWIQHRGTGGLNLYAMEAAPIGFHTSGTQRMVIAPNGNVGISVTSPNHLLTVGGGAQVYGIQIGASSLNGTDVDMPFPYESIGTVNTDYNLRLHSGKSIVFHTGLTASEPDDNSKVRMVIDETGKVGINTLTPSRMLDVSGSLMLQTSGFETNLSLNNSSTNGREYQLISSGSGGSFSGGSLGVWDATASTPRTYIAAGVNGWQTPSDRRLKKDITTLSVLDNLKAVRGVSYVLKDSNKPQIGVIAQEMQQAFPVAVTGKETSSTYLGVDYNSVAAIALQGVKELSARNEQQQAEIVALKKQNAELAASLQQFRKQVTMLLPDIDHPLH